MGFRAANGSYAGRVHPFRPFDKHRKTAPESWCIRGNTGAMSVKRGHFSELAGPKPDKDIGLMVDTIKSNFYSYEVSKSCEIEVTEIKSQGQAEEHYLNRFLYRNDQGEKVFGEKAQLRTPSFQAVIKPARRPHQNSDSQGDLFLEFTAPAIGRLHNYAPLNQAEFQEALLNVETQLHIRGISLSIMTGGISRVDLFRNITLDEPFANYSLLLNQLNGKRMAPCHHCGGTYFRWGNQQHCVVAYDKRAQMISRSRDVSDIPRQVMRFEYRMLNAKKAKKVLERRRLVN